MLYYRDSEILSGMPVFANTRVPVAALFDYLVGGHLLAEFLYDFPSVQRDQAVAMLQLARAMVLNTTPTRSKAM